MIPEKHVNIMLIYVPTASLIINSSSKNNYNYNYNTTVNKTSRRYSIASTASGFLAAAAIVITTAAGGVETPQEGKTFSNIPQELSGECASAKDCSKPRIQRPKSRKAESCTIKCVTTCIRGGEGSPGEGPFNVRRPLVVFKSGFRSRRYCLVECSDICNLIGDKDEEPFN